MKTIIVTGTTGALGSGIARELLELKYRVVGLARGINDEDLISHPNFVGLQYDLVNLNGIPGLIREITSEFGPVYGLVNNAALGLDSVLATMHAKQIQELLLVNLNAPIELAKHSIRGMLVARAGRIINITSVVAQTGYKGLSVYAATKAGLEGFSKSLAREVGKRGITVNNVAPGFMPSEMTAGLADAQMDQIRRRTPLGRLVSAQEVSNAVSFLLSDKASGITGITLTVDGGASC